MSYTVSVNLYYDDDMNLLKEGEGRPTRFAFAAGTKIPTDEARALGLKDETPATPGPAPAPSPAPAAPNKPEKPPK